MYVCMYVYNVLEGQGIATYHAILGNIPVTVTTNIFPKEMRCKWEAYCGIHGRHTAIQVGGVLQVIPFPHGSGALKALQYKLEVYCNAR